MQATDEVRTNNRGAERVLGVLILSYIVIFGYLTWSQQSNFGTFGFDMGIYDQGIWLLSHFKTPFLTVRGLNYFGHHVNLITLLFVPFYWLGGGPKFLYLIETVWMAFGALPLWLLARDRLSNPWLALFPAAVYLLYPSLEWINWWHFHPDALIVTPLIFAWWLVTRQRWGWFAFAVAITLSCKEDAALAVFMMGVLITVCHWWRDRHMPREANEIKGVAVGLMTIVAAILWWFFCTKIIIPFANDGVGPFYGNLFPGFGSGVIDVIVGILRNPNILWQAATRPDCLTYYLKLFVPVAGLFILSPVSLIGFPQLLVNVISAHGYTHDIHYHYSAIVSAAILLGTVEALGLFSRRKVWLFILISVLLFSTGWSNREWSPSPLGLSFRSGIWASPHAKHPALRRALSLVPPQAAVVATYYIVPHLTQRQLIYEYPNPFVTANWGVAGENPGNPAAVDYLVLDTTLNGDQGDLFTQLTSASGPFSIIFNEDGIVVAERQKSSILPWASN